MTEVLAPTIFLCHSSSDSAAVDRFNTVMALSGVTTWYSVQRLNVGDELLPGLFDGIDQSCVIVLFSSLSAASSNWVRTELRIASEALLEREKRIAVLQLESQECKRFTPFLADAPTLMVDAKKSEDILAAVGFVLRIVRRTIHFDVGKVRNRLSNLQREIGKVASEKPRSRKAIASFLDLDETIVEAVIDEFDACFMLSSALEERGNDYEVLGNAALAFLYVLKTQHRIHPLRLDSDANALEIAMIGSEHYETMLASAPTNVVKILKATRVAIEWMRVEGIAEGLEVDIDVVKRLLTEVRDFSGIRRSKDDAELLANQLKELEAESFEATLQELADSGLIKRVSKADGELIAIAEIDEFVKAGLMERVSTEQDFPFRRATTISSDDEWERALSEFINSQYPSLAPEDVEDSQ